MNMKLYMVYVASLVMLACSGADVSGSSDDPSVLTAEKVLRRAVSIRNFRVRLKII